jgi:cyclophilin family peptidyl-prolyl cis-trans isomerase
MCIDPAKKYTATFDTTEGAIVVQLDTAKTPKAANNFVVLARYHYYDGSSVFRTATDIGIIQGGGPNTQSNNDPGPGYNLADEGLPATYKDGDLVYANAGANTSSAQYFFGASDAVSALDKQGTYIKFGSTTQGLDVLHKILALNVDTGTSLGGAPSKVVLVNKITIAES